MPLTPPNAATNISKTSPACKKGKAQAAAGYWPCRRNLPGAALEYISNIHKDLLKRGIRDKAELLWLSNEAALGDFGVRGLQMKQKGVTVTSEDFISAVFDDYQIKWEVQKGVHKVEKDRVHWEDYAGNYGETPMTLLCSFPNSAVSPSNTSQRWRGCLAQSGQQGRIRAG